MSQGIKTSEMWVAVGTTLLVALNKKLGLGLEPAEVAVIAGLAVSYIGSRWHLKAAAAKADAA